MARLKQIEMAFDFAAPPDADTVLVAEPANVLPNGGEEAVSGKSASVSQPVAKPAARGRKSIKMMEAEAELIAIPPDEELFSKMYYSMNEVTQMFRANHSQIRFWENEFTILQPRKNKKGDRLFRPEDIKNLEIIYHLLRVKKYTIDGAKDYLKNRKKHHQQFETVQKLEQLKSFLLEIKASL